MKILKTFLLIALTACLMFSCEEDDEGDDKVVRTFEVHELAGDWEATTAGINSTYGLDVNILADDGAVSLTVENDGRCTFTIAPADREAYTMSGTMFWENDDGEDVFGIEYDDYPGDYAYYGVSYSSTVFHMGWDGSDDPNAVYDFNNEGKLEDGFLDFRFVRD